VYADGSICLDILQARWSPTYNVGSILTSIQSLLDEPNPASPANPEAARLYQEDRAAYARRVEQCVEETWSEEEGEGEGEGEGMEGDGGVKVDVESESGRLGFSCSLWFT